MGVAIDEDPVLADWLKPGRGVRVVEAAEEVLDRFDAQVAGTTEWRAWCLRNPQKCRGAELKRALEGASEQQRAAWIQANPTYAHEVITVNRTPNEAGKERYTQQLNEAREAHRTVPQESWLDKDRANADAYFAYRNSMMRQGNAQALVDLAGRGATDAELAAAEQALATGAQLQNEFELRDSEYSEALYGSGVSDEEMAKLSAVRDAAGKAYQSALNPYYDLKERYADPTPREVAKPEVNLEDAKEFSRLAAASGDAYMPSDYRGNGYSEITHGLRSGSPSDWAKPVIAEMDAVMRDARLPATTLYRGLTTSDWLKDGQVFTDRGFASSTTSPTIASAFAKASGGVTGPGVVTNESAVITRIKVPEGTRGVADASNRQEMEVVLDRGTKYKVVGRAVEEFPDIGPVEVIDLEIVGQRRVA